jgi:hypothetical protein
MMDKRKVLYEKYGKWFTMYWWFGFECGDGWLQLIDDTLSEVIAWYEKNHPNELDDDEGFVILQVKEKYAGLRIYIGSSYRPVFDMLSEAEKKSYTICEICGEPGRERYDGKYWYKTLCDSHFDEWMGRYD